MKCPECHKGTTRWQMTFYGGMCAKCYISIPKDSLQGEWSRSAKQELQTYAKDILQPFKKDGTINKHFVEAHGTQSLEKETKMTPQEIRNNVERYG